MAVAARRRRQPSPAKTRNLPSLQTAAVVVAVAVIGRPTRSWAFPPCPQPCPKVCWGCHAKPCQLRTNFVLSLRIPQPDNVCSNSEVPCICLDYWELILVRGLKSSTASSRAEASWVRHPTVTGHKRVHVISDFVHVFCLHGELCNLTWHMHPPARCAGMSHHVHVGYPSTHPHHPPCLPFQAPLPLPWLTEERSNSNNTFTAASAVRSVADHASLG